PLHRFRLGEVELGHGPQPLLDRDAQLGPGEVGAETAVGPGPEGQVAVLAAVEVAGVGVVEVGGVAVGGAEGQEDPLAGGDAPAVEVDVGAGEAPDGDGGVEPQQLLQGGGDEGRVAGQAAPVGPVGRQVPEAGADGAPRGV